eukprot:superscaffoldBa00002254_g13683
MGFFMKVAGVIDGCHVRIKPPSCPGGHCYRNRRLLPSIILQAVCDHQGHFTDTYVGWPGSVHDSRVLRHSPLYRSIFYPPGHFILADGGSRASNTSSPSSLPTRGQYKVIITWTVFHNICLEAGDIVAPENESEEDVEVEEDERENGLETVSGSLWREQLSAEVSGLEEVPPDHDYF